jgi:hypothetical protein
VRQPIGSIEGSKSWKLWTSLARNSDGIRLEIVKSRIEVPAVTPVGGLDANDVMVCWTVSTRFCGEPDRKVVAVQ